MRAQTLKGMKAFEWAAAYDLDVWVDAGKWKSWKDVDAQRAFYEWCVDHNADVIDEPDFEGGETALFPVAAKDREFCKALVAEWGEDILQITIARGNPKVEERWVMRELIRCVFSDIDLSVGYTIGMAAADFEVSSGITEHQAYAVCLRLVTKGKLLRVVNSDNGSGRYWFILAPPIVPTLLEYGHWSREKLVKMLLARVETEYAEMCADCQDEIVYKHGRSGREANAHNRLQ